MPSSCQPSAVSSQQDPGARPETVFANDQQPTTNDQQKKPCAGFPDTGLVSLTTTCSAI